MFVLHSLSLWRCWLSSLFDNFICKKKIIKNEAADSLVAAGIQLLAVDGLICFFLCCWCCYCCIYFEVCLQACERCDNDLTQVYPRRKGSPRKRDIGEGGVISRICMTQVLRFKHLKNLVNIPEKNR